LKQGCKNEKREGRNRKKGKRHELFGKEFQETLQWSRHREGKLFDELKKEKKIRKGGKLSL